MNLLAFIFVLVGGIFGVVEVFKAQGKSWVGWAAVLISIGVILQEVMIDWSHTVHS